MDEGGIAGRFYIQFMISDDDASGGAGASPAIASAFTAMQPGEWSR